MTTLRQKAFTEAARLGVTLDLQGPEGQPFGVTIDSPKGKLLGCSGIHCHVAWTRDSGWPFKAKECWGDVLEALDGLELEPCSDPDCDICEEK